MGPEAFEMSLVVSAMGRKFRGGASEDSATSGGRLGGIGESVRPRSGWRSIYFKSHAETNITAGDSTAAIAAWE